MRFVVLSFSLVLQKPLVQWKLKDSYAASQLRTLYQGSDNSHNSRQIKHQQNEVDDELKEITELEFRQSCPHLGYLIRIELEEEDIDPLYKQCLRNKKKDAHNNTAKKRARVEKGESSSRKNR